MVFRYNQVKNYILICMCFIGQNLCLIFLNFLVFFTVIMYNINEKIGIIFIINVFFLILYIRLVNIYIYIYMRLSQILYVRIKCNFHDEKLIRF